MKKVLYINGNPQQEDQSYSRRVGRYLVNEKSRRTNEHIDEINLYEEYIPLIDEDVLSAWGALRDGESFEDLSVDQQSKVGRMNELLEQFKAADEYIFITPLWNFSVSPMLKAYIDNIMIAGETFKYTEEGPVGLLTDKKATIIQASGGVYSDALASIEHGANLLETVLGFVGIKDVQTVRVEGIAIPGKSDEERLSEVYKQVDDLMEFDAV
jgi:FMN-dependent NADH-azoreductase